jgi:hypothetical protein
MNISQIYIAVSIVVLAVIAILFFFVNKNKKEKRLTPLAGLAFGFILAGIFFGDNRFLPLWIFLISQRISNLMMQNMSANGNVVYKKQMSYECRVHAVVILSAVPIMGFTFERSKP